MLIDMLVLQSDPIPNFPKFGEDKFANLGISYICHESVVVEDDSHKEVDDHVIANDLECAEEHDCTRGCPTIVWKPVMAICPTPTIPDVTSCSRGIEVRRVAMTSNRQPRIMWT